MRILLPLSSGLISVVVGSVQHLSSDLDSDLVDLDYLLDENFVPIETGAQESSFEQSMQPIDQEKQNIGEDFNISHEVWKDLLETLDDGESGKKRKADDSLLRPGYFEGPTSSVGGELSNEACELLEMVVSEIPEISVVDLRVQFALNRFVKIPSEAAIAAWLGTRQSISMNSAEKIVVADVDLGLGSLDEVEETICPENVIVSSSAAEGRTDLSETLRGFINGDEVDENLMKKLRKEHTVTMPDASSGIVLAALHELLACGASRRVACVANVLVGAQTRHKKSRVTLHPASVRGLRDLIKNRHAYLKILILEIARLGTWKCGRGGTMTKLHEAVSERLAQAKLGILSQAVVERTVCKIRGALTASQGAPEKATYDHKSIVQEVLSSPGAASLQRNDLVNRAVGEFIARGLPPISEFCVKRIVDKCRDELGLMGSSSLPALRREIISNLPFRLLKREKVYELFRAEWFKQHQTEPCTFRTFEPDLRWVRKTHFSARP